MKALFKIIIVGFLLIPLIVFGENQSLEFKRKYDSIYIDFHYKYFDNSDFSFSEHDRQEIRNLYELNNKSYSAVANARIQYLDAFVSFSDTLPNYEKAITLIDNALNVLTKEKFPVDYAKLLALKATIYITKRTNYVEAYQYIQETLDILTVEKDPAFVGLSYYHLTMLWRYLGENENALENIDKSEKILRENGFEKTAFLMQLTRNNIQLQMGQDVIHLLKDDLSMAKNQNDTSTIIFLDMIIGNAFAGKGDFDKAFQYLYHARDYVEAFSVPYISRKCDILYSLGILFYRKKDFEQATAYLNSVLPYVKQLNMLNYESNIYFLFSEIEHKNNKDETAYNYLKKSVAIRDSLDKQKRIGELQRIKTHAELMNYQQEVKIIKQQSEIRQTRSALVIVILILAIVVISFILLYLNRKKQLNNLKISQLDQELRNKEIISKLEKIELEKQVEEKEREVATTQLLIAEKNRVLGNLIDTFKPLYSANKISEKVWRELQLFVTSNQRKENEWEKSKIHFEKVHPNFFKNLKNQFPTLTENELRLCAYIRIGIRSKEIAEMLSIDHKSVISNRYHLKKKMNLQKEQSLDDFIRGI